MLSEEVDYKIILKSMLVFLWPRIIIIFLIFISIAIVGFGMRYSIENNDWSIFSRSGSVLVIIALIVAIVDHSYWSKKAIEVGNKAITEKRKEQFKDNFYKVIREDLDKYKVEKSENEINYLVNKEYTKYLEDLPERIGTVTRKSLQKYELIVASVGTVIWGFGDLLGCLL